MSRGNFFRNNVFKSFIIAFLAFSYPLYATSQIMFDFILIFILLIASFAVDYIFYQKTYNNLMDWLLYRLLPPWFQLLLLYLFILIILNLIGNTKLNNYLPLIILFCWTISLLSVVAVSRNIYSLIMKIREMANERKLFSFGIIILSFLTLVVSFFIPDLMFGLGYSIFLTIFGNVSLNMLDSFYLSLIISNTLPVGEPFSKYITVIGENPYIYLFQFFHIFSNKIINWIVIGVVFNYIFLVIDSRRKIDNK